MFEKIFFIARSSSAGEKKDVEKQKLKKWKKAIRVEVVLKKKDIRALKNIKVKSIKKDFREEKINLNEQKSIIKILILNFLKE